MEFDDDHSHKGLQWLSSELQDKIQSVIHRPSLPHWPEQTRGIPNICLRSALFGVIQRGRRKAVKGERIAAVTGLVIRYTGWRLDQSDFDVLTHALHLVSLQQTTEEYVYFTGKGFLHGIGRSPGKSGREWLKDSFRRLTGSAVEITLEINDTYGKNYCTYAGSLIDEFYCNSTDQSYSLKINPKLAKLFSAGWTQLHWHQRLQLKTDLAKWLHGFYSSHKVPFPMKVETLRHLCGSGCARLADFRTNLRRALDELVKAELITTWHIDHQDKLHVQKQKILCSGISNGGGIAVVKGGHSGRKGGA